MKITINGKEKEFESSLDLCKLINDLSKNPTRVIAELNGNIVKSPSWESTPLKDGDTLELVTFVGGG